MKFNIDEIIKVTGAKILHKTNTEGTFKLSTDTRKIDKNQNDIIYLPLRGENFDGHNFIDKALENGAAGYFTQEQYKVNKNAKFVLYVKNTLIAYLELAKYIREKINPKVIAITGSSGKTTTKEMLSSVLETTFKTHKSKLNHNNEIGLCETMFSMPEDTEILVVEMGMRNLGEIQLLTSYALPDAGIITNIGSAHVERLGNLKNIALAKCEIASNLRPDGIFIGQNSEILNETLKYQGEKILVQISDCTNIEIEIGKSAFDYKKTHYALNIEGEHNIENAMLVIEAAKWAGVSDENIKKGLLNYKPIEKRWEITKIGDLTFINDSYNANPESMMAVLKTFLSVYKKPLCVLLGDMGELGKDEIAYHKKIGGFLSSYKDVTLLTVGELAKFISRACTLPSKHFNSKQECANYIKDNLEAGTTILLKASRIMKFEEIIEMVKNL